MQFCPICSNLLLVELGEVSFRFCCQTCPYISAITKKISKTMKLKRKPIAEKYGAEIEGLYEGEVGTEVAG